jgi:hypothetical protein
MSKIVEVPDDVYARIEKAASAADMTAAEWVASLFPERPCGLPRTAAQRTALGR